jgi:hypothetical protein
LPHLRHLRALSPSECFSFRLYRPAAMTNKKTNAFPLLLSIILADSDET